MASTAIGRVYLLPTFLDAEHLETIPAYVTDAAKECQAFFVENERSARRYLKQIWRDMVIDNYEWFTIHKAEDKVKETFKKLLQRGMTIGILSEAGCPGIADPGQILIGEAHRAGAEVKPFVGPSSILLALMASGLNGQQFKFHGYLPIDSHQRAKIIKELEADALKNKATQIFIETPYRNNQLLEALIHNCNPSTQLCIAADITGKSEFIKTKTIASWQKTMPDIHKRPTIFLIYADGFRT
jgi:16S rRNA (cytidine1402-2'-O)-methyltransferase